METLEFIRNDLANERKMTPAKVAFFAFGMCFIPLGFGVFARSNSVGLFAPFPLISNLLAGGLLAFFPVVYRYRAVWGPRARASLFATWAFALFFSMDRALVSAEPGAGFADAGFWRGVEGCFGRGALSAVLVAAWLGWFTFRAGSLPSRSWRVFGAAAAGVSASVMLGVHCESGSILHLAFGHLAPGIVIGLVAYTVLEAVFRNVIRRKLPGLVRAIDRPDRLA